MRSGSRRSPREKAPRLGEVPFSIGQGSHDAAPSPGQGSVGRAEALPTETRLHAVLSYAAGPALTLVVLLAAMAARGIFPFGDHPFLARDGVIQYVGFYGWYHDVLTGGAGLEYSFAKGLGGDTFGLFAYYLSSPLAVLAAFFDAPRSIELFSLIAPAKIVLSAAACSAYLVKRLNRRSIALSTLGCAYALSSYTFVSGLNVMWLDGMALAPVVALGAFRIVRGRSPAVLLASAALAILANWYVGYMVCLFAVVAFFAELAVRPRGASPRLWACIGRFALAMALAVGIGLAVLLPVAEGQLSSGGLGEGSGFLDTVRAGVSAIGPLNLLRALVDPSAPFGASSANPASVSWTLLALACAMFFLPGRTRAKVVAGAVLALFAASMALKPLDMVWTGFVRADSYNPRYFFLVLLVLCACAGRTVVVAEDALAKRFGEGRAVGRGRIAVAAAMCALMAIGAGRLSLHGLSGADLNGYQSGSVSRYEAYLSALEEAHEAARDDAQGSGPSQGGASQEGASLDASQDEGPSQDASPDASQGDSQGAAVPFFRMENAAGSSVAAMRVGEPASGVDALSEMMPSGEYLAAGDSSLSHYSSSADGSMKTLLGSLGYCLLPGTRGVTTYHAPMYLTDSLLGVRYVLATGEPAGMSELEANVPLSSRTGEPVGLWKNDGALGIGFAVPSSLEGVSWSSDPFYNQMAFIGALAGDSAAAAALYVPASVASAGQAGASDVVGVAGGSASESADEGGTVHAEADSSTRADADAARRAGFTVRAAEDGPLYLWVASAPAGATVSVDGRELQTTRSYEYDTNVMYLGNRRAGEEVEVSLGPGRGSASGGDLAAAQLEARTLRMPLAQSLLSGLGSSSFQVTAIRDGEVEGRFSASEGEGLLLTIPDERGWTAWVDGEETAVSNVNGLMKIDMPAGDHEVRLSYRTPGLLPGAVASALSCAVAVAWLVARARRLRR